MGKKWDRSGIAFDADLWTLIYQKLKPGGVVKVFSAARTYHRLAQVLEEAGFTDLSLEAWGYGTGFPKNLNISKSIDKRLGFEGTPVGVNPSSRPNSKRKGGRGFDTLVGSGDAGSAGVQYITEPTTKEAQFWDGYGTAVRPSWEPFLTARKPVHAANSEGDKRG
jgi:site-specific DNA-methyltransferase (adenine-specific)